MKSYLFASTRKTYTLKEIINLNKCFFKDKQKDFDETKLEHFTVQVNNLKKIVTVNIIITYEELNRIRNTKKSKEEVLRKTSVVYNIDSKKDENFVLEEQYV